MHLVRAAAKAALVHRAADKQLILQQNATSKAALITPDVRHTHQWLSWPELRQPIPLAGTVEAALDTQLQSDICKNVKDNHLATAIFHAGNTSEGELSKSASASRAKLNYVAPRLCSFAWLSSKARIGRYRQAFKVAVRNGIVDVEETDEYLNFDESPMRTRKDKQESKKELPSTRVLVATSIKNAKQPTKGATVAKLFLPFMSELWCFKKLGEPPNKRLLVILDHLSLWQNLHDMHTPHVYKSFLQQGMGQALAESTAPRKGSFSQSDRHPTNFASMKHFWRHISKMCDVALAKFDCHAHMAFDGFKECSKPVEDVIQAQLRCSLSQVMAAHRQNFRLSIKDAVLAYGRIFRGSAGPEAELYRRLGVRLLGGVGMGRIRRQAILYLLPNGNWLKRFIVEFFVDDPDALDKAEFLREAAEAIANVFTDCAWQLWAKSKWNGAETSAAQQTFPNLAHNLLCLAWPYFEARCKKKPLPEPVFGPVAGAGAANDGANNGNANGNDGNAADDLQLANVPNDAAHVVAQYAARSNEGAGSTEKNVKSHLDVVKSFLAQIRPTSLTRQLLWRMHVNICDNFLQQILKIGSAKWETKQQAAAAKNNDPRVLGRDFPILIAARGDIEHEALAKVETLSRDPRMWMLVPDEDCNNRTRAMGYLMQTGLGVILHKNFLKPHAHQPFTSFLGLLNPAFYLSLDREKPCMRDPWSAQRAKEGAYKNADSLYGLLGMAHLLQIHNAYSENCNAWAQRLLRQRVHTHERNVSQLNQRWVAKCCADRSKEDTSGGAARASSEPPLKILRRCGGGYRDFVRESASNDLRAVARRWNSMTDADKEPYQERGKEATERGKLGVPKNQTAFGMRRREAISRNHARIAEARVQQLMDQNTTDHADAVVQLASREHLQPSEYARELLQLYRAGNAARRAADEAIQRELVEYKQRVAAEAQENLADMFPSIAASRDDLEPLPVGWDCQVVRIDIASAAAADAVTLQNIIDRAHKNCTLAKECEQLWTDLCCEVKASPKDELKFEGDVAGTPEYPISRCWKNLICLCGDMGAHLVRLRDSFLRCLKDSFPVGSAHRSKLVDRKIFVMLTFSVPEAAAGEDEFDLELWGMTEHVYQISHHSFVPYTSWLHENKIIEDPDLLEEANPAGNELALEVLQRFVAIILGRI